MPGWAQKPISELLRDKGALALAVGVKVDIESSLTVIKEILVN